MATCDYTLDPRGDVILAWTNGANDLWDLGIVNSSSSKDGPQRDDSQTNSKQQSNVQASSNEMSSNEAANAVQTTFRLSSRHVTLASTVFGAMLNGEWTEGQTKNDGCFHISGEDWDKEAFEVVMNIAHGHHRKVPKTLDIKLLAKIAVIVDYYKLHEIVEIFSDKWIAHMRKSVPQ